MRVCLACDARFESDGWQCPECGAAPEARGHLRFPRGSLSAADGFPEASFADQPRREERSFWFGARNELLDWALRTYFPAASSFLEVGCGTGVVLAALSSRHPGIVFSGAEPSAAGLEIAHARAPDVALFELDGRRLPFVEEFDVVAAFDVLEHVDEDDDVLAEMYRTVKPGGGLMLTVPHHPKLWSAVDEFSRHRRRYTARGLVAKVQAAGFEIIRKTAFVTFLLPVVAISRWKDRKNSDYDPATEFRLPGAVEAAFSYTMAAERRLITWGVSFPAGSSLLLVARRP